MALEEEKIRPDALKPTRYKSTVFRPASKLDYDILLQFHMKQPSTDV